MNPWRFLRKCLTDRPAAWRSAKLIGRSFYSQCYWLFKPGKPLKHHLPQGGVLWLEPKHSFTHCFYPGVDQYEPDVREALQYLLKPGYTFIDCGANIGYFSIQAGSLVGSNGTIISIEANPITYSLLRHNLQANQFGIAVHCALTSQVGEVELFVPSEGDVYSSLQKGGLVRGDSIQTFKVQGRTLDDVIQSLSLDQVDVVKIDIEGAELDVLKSAPQLLSIFRPIVIMEYGTNTWISFGATPESLKNLVESHHYCLRQFNLQTKCLVPIAESVWQSPYANLILVPKEQVG